MLELSATARRRKKVRDVREGYQEDLAYIHDVGFGDFSIKAAPGLLRILRRVGIKRGLVVDLGCGSGLWARELIRAGYDVQGIDISPSMIKLARKRPPKLDSQQHPSQLDIASM